MMKYIRGTTDFYIERSTAVTLGKFDGMHLGHQTLLARIQGQKKQGLCSAVVAFDFGREENLMLNEERRQMLENLDVDYLLECPFVPEISRMEPEVFVREILVKRLQARYLAVGTDFHFGHNRKGDYRLLEEMAKEWGFQTEVAEKARYKGREISSTYIREELRQGHMELVNQLLGYTYSVTGEVLHGRKIGRTLGMPTLNLLPDERKLLPPNGVYATRTRVGKELFNGITNVGYKPTVGAEPKKGVETYLFDVERELYGETITVQFYGFERLERRFESLEELKSQLLLDVAWGKEYFTL